MFDPETNKWSSYQEKPTKEFLEKLRSSNVHQMVKQVLAATPDEVALESRSRGQSLAETAQ